MSSFMATVVVYSPKTFTSWNISSFPTLSDFIRAFDGSTGIWFRWELNNKVNMFTHCYIEKRVGTCTCILVYINIAFLASYMALLIDCLLFLDGVVVFRFWCRGDCPIIILSFCCSLYWKCYAIYMFVVNGTYPIRCLPLL